MKIDQLYKLFDKALELNSPEQLDQFLQQNCGDDDGRRQELLGLLQAHQRGNRLLDSPTEAMELSLIAPHEREGELIGSYRLLQKIGEGGMGVVFMAEQQQPIRRKVALKVIREGINSKQILARFEAEREALARLDHPNATRILDAGVTNRGRPYFVMDLVRGTHITHFCNSQRLTVNQRLELMEKVCLVIHHAHQKGILHRDIKPGNVMITLHDSVPVPKVIDFGIAKALDGTLTEQTLFTRYGDLVGTPEYMSPEQAEMSGLDLDVRTDIYSLGVMLYELLTGSTPLSSDQIKGRGLLKVFETIRDSEAELPSLRVTKTMSASETIADERLSTPKLLRKCLSGDLDWITMKALAKDRNERYESAAAMAKDIRNYLQGEPVEAAAPSLAYRARKFYRKHRSVSIVAAAFTLLLLVSTALSVYWAIVSAKNERIASDKSIQLEEKSAALEKALTRALSAEKKAEALARAESRRATEASANMAMVQHIAKQHAAQFRNAIFAAKESQGDRPEAGQVAQIGARLELMLSQIGTSVVSPSELTSGQVSIVQTQETENAAPLPVPITIYQGKLPAGESMRGPSLAIAPEFASSQSSRVIVDVRDLKKPLIYYDFLLAEQRKTFGNRDLFVAETLYLRALARMEPTPASREQTEPTQEPQNRTPMNPPLNQPMSPAVQPDWVANENDLREAIAILADHPDAELAKAETAALLTYTLRAQQKYTQAVEFSDIARATLQRLSTTDPGSAEAKRIAQARHYLDSGVD